MKELVYHRTFLPAIDRWASKVGFHDGEYHATFAQHGERVLRLADAMHTTLGLDRGDRFAVMSANSHQYLELQRRVPRPRRDQPAEPAPGRQGAAVHPG